MVTSPAWGTPAAPMEAAVAVMLEKIQSDKADDKGKVRYKAMYQTVVQLFYGGIVP